jgi:cyanate permease
VKPPALPKEATESHSNGLNADTAADEYPELAVNSDTITGADPRGHHADNLRTSDARAAYTGVRPVMSPAVTLLLSVACGLAVANAYYSQPLLDTMANEFAISHATIGIIGTVTQVGYGLGLLLVVPLGELFDRRDLIVGQSLLSLVALVAVALAPTAEILLASMAAVGLLAVVAVSPCSAG